jgi:hypothetical protein
MECLRYAVEHGCPEDDINVDSDEDGDKDRNKDGDENGDKDRNKDGDGDGGEDGDEDTLPAARA